MISISRALKIVKKNTVSCGSVRIDLTDAVGCVLAEDVVADSDLPPFDRSQMDGYAVRANDGQELRVVGESAAGSGWHGRLKKGEAVRIMTGAAVPEGADAVQKIELTSEANGIVRILEPTAKGRFIVPKGKEIEKGKLVIRKGEVITEKNIAIPAAFGYAKLKVAKRPRITIISTGSEIVDIGKRPGPDQIRNSNSMMLQTLCERDGGSVTVLPIVGDDISDLKSQILKAAKVSDMVVTTGGVSVGKYDLTKPALLELGAEIFFEHVRLKPGKPTVFAKLRKALIFALPGNPVSAAVTYYLFVRKAILQMQGARQTDLKPVAAVAGQPVKGNRERDSYVPSQLSTDEAGRLIVRPVTWHGSSDFIGFARADALAIVGRGTVSEAGDPIKVLLI